ncbi:MAG TPA: ABC transporter substrate-binding protein [Candidatus Limnocylindrales bacterium]|nr:ABC transporter substrate-binding protein [Candidatus Limnocylindrales bacterium]
MPVPHLRRLATGIALVLTLAACGSSGTSIAPTIPADATGSLLPPATATPPPSPSAAPAFPVTLTDDEGTDVDLAAAPEQIVSLTPAETEILYALGAGDRVVGKVEDVASFPPEAADVPVVGTFSGVDVEKIVSLGTDLVIAGGNGGTQPEAIEKLRSLKIPVLVVYAADVDGVYHDIGLTGDAVGDSQAADELVASLQAGFDTAATATAGAARPRVFYETGDQPSIYGIADDSVYEQMITLAGGTPITTGSTTNWEQSTEKLVDADPELIILGDSAYGVTADAVAKRPGWSGMTAVKDHRIVGIDDILVTRPGPRLADGLRLLVAAIHPELQLASPAPSGSGG